MTVTVALVRGLGDRDGRFGRGFSGRGFELFSIVLYKAITSAFR